AISGCWSGTVILNSTSADVFHSFGIPLFKVKRDAIPGRVNQAWFIADTIGIPVTEPEYFQAVRCYELCGTGHALMFADLWVLGQDNFFSFYTTGVYGWRKCGRLAPPEAMAVHDEPQGRRHSVPLHVALLLRRGGSARPHLSVPARRPVEHVPSAGRIQPGRDDPRSPDALVGPHSPWGGVRELLRADPDRRAGHGVPP